MQIVLTHINSVSWLEWFTEYRVSKGRGSGNEEHRTLTRHPVLQIALCMESAANSAPLMLGFWLSQHCFLPTRSSLHLTALSSMTLLAEASLLQTLVGNSLCSVSLRNCARDPDASCTSSQASVTSLYWGCFPREKPGFACEEKKDFCHNYIFSRESELVRVQSPS